MTRPIFVRDIEKTTYDYAITNSRTPGYTIAMFSSIWKLRGKMFVSFHNSELSLCVWGWFRCVGYKRSIAITSNRYFSCELRSNLKLSILSANYSQRSIHCIYLSESISNLFTIMPGRPLWQVSEKRIDGRKKSFLYLTWWKFAISVNGLKLIYQSYFKIGVWKFDAVQPFLFITYYLSFVTNAERVCEVL